MQWTRVRLLKLRQSTVGSTCTDTLASNYHSEAVVDDGTCRYGGCLDTSAFNYNPSAHFNDKSCRPIVGCQDSRADNYVAELGVDSGPCVYAGCMPRYGPNP